MPSDPATAVYNLMKKDPSIIAAAVIRGNREIVFSTDNWVISGDVDKVISSWNSQNAQFIIISGVKYSILQCTTERLVATSIRGEGHILGAKDENYKLIVYLEPDGEPMGATMDTARALAEMSPKETVYDQVQSGYGSSGVVGQVGTSSSGSTVDPMLKGEIQSFLEWIKDQNGLAGYVNYYLQQNNSQIISELARIYYELRQIFGA